MLEYQLHEYEKLLQLGVVIVQSTAHPHRSLYQALDGYLQHA